MFDWILIPRRRVLGGLLAVGAATMARPRLGLGLDKKLVRIRARADIASIDPAQNQGVDEQFIIYATQSNLITFKPGEKWEWQLDAASAIKQEDPTHISFKLRPGIQWTNGFGELTAEDVKYSYERMASQKLQATDRQEFEHLVEVQVTDKLSGVIVTKSPVANIWTNTLPRYMSSIVSKRAWEERGGSEKGLGTNIPCFSGPYKLKEWVPRQYLHLERNELWNGPPVYFDEVKYVLVEDDKAAELAYLTGELDISSISVGSAARFKASPPPNTDIYARPTTGFVWLGINVDHKPYDDIRVRQAVRAAIDVQQIIDAAYFGVPQPSTGIIAPGLMGHRDAPIPKRDVALAKKLLAEAGLPNGFKTRISTPNGTEDTTAAQVIQANLADVGITAEVMPYDSGTYWDLGLESKGKEWQNLELIYQDWTSSADPRRATQWFVSSQAGEWNWQRWRNEEYDKLDAAASLEMDPEKRAALYRRMMDIMYDSSAFINITHRPWVTLVHNSIDPQLLPNGYVYARYLKAKA